MSETPRAPLTRRRPRADPRPAREARATARGRREAYPVGVPRTHTIAAGPRRVPRPRGGRRRPTTRSAWPAASCSSASAASSASPRCRTARATGCRRCSASTPSGEERLAAFKTDVDLGDHLFVHGRVIASRRGELSVLADEWQIAAKSLRPLPNLYEGVELSEEARVRQRYVDLIVRPAARETARLRAGDDALAAGQLPRAATSSRSRRRCCRRSPAVRRRGRSSRT